MGVALADAPSSPGEQSAGSAAPGSGASPGVIYQFAWGNNERRTALKGRACVIDARGAKATVLVRFLDTGERVTCSFRALRRVA